MMGSGITVYYCILLELLDPQPHEIFRHSCAEIVVVASGRVFYSFIMCLGSCNCSLQAVAERPHSYLTLGPLHHLAHSQKRSVRIAFTVASIFQPCRPDATQLRVLPPARAKASGNCSTERSSCCQAVFVPMTVHLRCQRLHHVTNHTLGVDFLLKLCSSL